MLFVLWYSFPPFYSSIVCLCKKNKKKLKKQVSFIYTLKNALNRKSVMISIQKEKEMKTLDSKSLEKYIMMSLVFLATDPMETCIFFLNLKDVEVLCTNIEIKSQWNYDLFESCAYIECFKTQSKWSAYVSKRTILLIFIFAK